MFKNPQTNIRGGDKVIFPEFLTSVCPETHPAQCRPGKHSRTLQSFRGQGTGSERKIRRRKWKESTTCVGSTRCDTWSRRRATSRDIVERDAESKQNRRVA